MGEGEVEGIPLDATLVSLWWRSIPDQAEKATMRTLLVSPNDKILDEMSEIELDLTEMTRIRSIQRFQGMPYAGSGIYKFIVQLSDESPEDSWRDIATLFLSVAFSPKE